MENNEDNKKRKKSKSGPSNSETWGYNKNKKNYISKFIKTNIGGKNACYQYKYNKNGI